MLQPELIPFQGMGIMMVKRQHLWFIDLLTLRIFSLAGRITGAFPGYIFNWHRKYIAFLGNYIYKNLLLKLCYCLLYFLKILCEVSTGLHCYRHCTSGWANTWNKILSVWLKISLSAFAFLLSFRDRLQYSHCKQAINIPQVIPMISSCLSFCHNSLLLFSEHTAPHCSEKKRGTKQPQTTLNLHCVA